MLELYLAEMRRYRLAAVLFGLASAAASHLYFRTSTFLEAAYYVQTQCFALYLLSGIAFAAFQFGSYRKPARWLWLLHRPLSRVRTFMAVHLAAATLIILACGLPLLMTLLLTKVQHVRVIDSRHFIGAIHLMLFMVLGWQTMGYVMLARHRGAFLVMILPVMLAGLAFASAYVLLVPALLCVVVMGCALFTVFRPARISTANANPGAVAVAAVPVAVCFYYVAIWGSTIVFTIAHTATGMMKAENQVRGGMIEAMSASAHHQLLDGELAKSSDPRAPAWREQIKSQEERRMTPNMRHHPVRHALTNAGYSHLYAVDNDWTFSHDRLQFVARNNRSYALSGKALGPTGVKDPVAFNEPAVSIDPSKHMSFVYTRKQLWLWDHKTLAMQPLLTFQGNEVIASLPEAEGDTMSMLTNERYLDYAWPAVNGVLTERFSIPLPGPLSDLGPVHSIKVSDGNIVTFLYAQQQEYGMTDSRVFTYFVQNGKITPVHERTLVLDVGFLYTQRFYWLSPVMFHLYELPRRWIDTGRVLDAGLTVDTMKTDIQRPPQAQLLALFLLLASGGVAWYRLRQQNMSATNRAAWILANLIFGLPALIAILALLGKPSTKRIKETKQVVNPA